MGPNFAEWLWTPETLCRVTPYQIAHYMADKMKELWGPCRVWSVYSNLGNETALLIDHGFTVVCSEPSAAGLCRRNLENTGLAPALELRVDLDPLDPAHWPSVDVVILNPPWGSGYERQLKSQFDLASVDVGGRLFLDYFDAVRDRYGNVVVVAPARTAPFDQHRPADHTIEFTKLRIHYYIKHT